MKNSTFWLSHIGYKAVRLFYKRTLVHLLPTKLLVSKPIIFTNSMTILNIINLLFYIKTEYELSPQLKLRLRFKASSCIAYDPIL